MLSRKSYIFRRIKSVGLAGHKVLPCALLTLYVVVCGIYPVGCSAQASTKLTKGSTLPIYLSPAALAEANQPSLELAPTAGGQWVAGPERFYGWALRDLRDYLQKMTGAQYPLTALDANVKSGVFAGTFEQFPGFKPQQANSQKVMASTDPEAFVIEAQGDRLFILGKTNFGLIAGIYTFLDKLGCKWFAPGQEWENVPQLNGLMLDSKLNLTSSGPSYTSRNFYPSWGPNTNGLNTAERNTEYALWTLRNRMGGSTNVDSSHHAGIVPETLFETRPELFAKITKGPWLDRSKGGRLRNEIARSNPEVVKMAVADAIRHFKDNAGKGSFYNSYSVEPNDGAPADEEAMERIGNHTPTDVVVWFANQVAEGIEKAELKDKWVGILSYFDHAEVPSIDLHPKVAVTVTTDLSFTKLTVEQRLDGYRQRKARLLGIYEYLNLVVWSSDRPGMSPSADARLVAENLKRWYDHGARTYMAETSDSWVSGGAGHYMTSRLLWDVNSDPQKELDAYYQGAFGPAAKEIRALNESWAKRPAMTRGSLAQWHDWISTADQKTRGNPLIQARIADIKRYYLLLNLRREFEINLHDPRVPAKAERWNRLLSYIAANRGGGSFHALGLLMTTLYDTGTPANPEVKVEQLTPTLQEILKGTNPADVWKQFPPLGDEQISTMFAAARLPLNGQAVGAGVLDPAIKPWPANARPPAEIKFPMLHNGGNFGAPIQHVLKVLSPTSLTLTINATNQAGGAAMHTVIVTGPLGNEISKLQLADSSLHKLNLPNLRPGIYTVTFPDNGSNQLTVSGGNTFGATRAFGDVDWGFNPFRFAGQKEVRSYFAVPAGSTSLKVHLSSGTVALGFQDGGIIAAEVKGSAALKKEPAAFPFAASDKPRMAYVQWPEAGNPANSVGLVIEGVTLYSPDPSYALYESLD